jgi:hypothetical protein
MPGLQRRSSAKGSGLQRRILLLFAACLRPPVEKNGGLPAEQRQAATSARIFAADSLQMQQTGLGCSIAGCRSIRRIRRLLPRCRESG